MFLCGNDVKTKSDHRSRQQLPRRVVLRQNSRASSFSEKLRSEVGLL